jgi:hypothetical protein
MVNALSFCIFQTLLGHEIAGRWPTPKEQVLLLLILSGQGQLHASGHQWGHSQRA